MSSFHFVPPDQYIEIEVYLPKNLLNYGTLIKLLTEVVEINEARKWLIENIDDIKGKPMEMIKLDFNEITKTFDLKSFTDRKRLLLLFGIEINDEDLEFEDIGVNQEFKSKQNSTYYWSLDDKFLVIGKKEGLFTPSTYISTNAISSSHFKGNEYMGLITKERIEKIENVIQGYSIYEVDGAFQLNEPVRPVSLDKNILLDNKIDVSKIGELFNLLKSKIDISKNDELYYSLDDICGKKYLFKITSDDFIENEYLLMKILEFYDFYKEGDIEIKTEGNGSQYVYYKNEGKQILAYEIEKENGYLFFYGRKLTYDFKEGRETNFILINGRPSYSIHLSEEKIKLSTCINIIEERTLVIRFLVDLNLGYKRDTKEIINNIINRIENNDSDHFLTEANKKTTDALLLIGYFLVKNLGKKGFEEEIWLTLNTGYLWKCKRGQFFKMDYEMKNLAV